MILKVSGPCAPLLYRETEFRHPFPLLVPTGLPFMSGPVAEKVFPDFPPFDVIGPGHVVWEAMCQGEKVGSIVCGRHVTQPHGPPTKETWEVVAVVKRRVGDHWAPAGETPTPYVLYDLLVKKSIGLPPCKDCLLEEVMGS